MKLFPHGIDNNIVEFRAKTKEVIVNLNDADGTFVDLAKYDAYFYAKKYPINSDPTLDVSIYHSTKDDDNGIVTFDLYPVITDIQQGDYVYEIVLIGDNKKLTVVKDRLKIIKSLDTEYGFVTFDVTPSQYTFNVKDMSTNMNISISDGLIYYNIIDEDWISSEIDHDNVSRDVALEVNDIHTEDKSGRITVSTAYQTKYVDVNYIYSKLTLDISAMTFTPYVTSIPVNIDVNDIDDWYISNLPAWLNVDIDSGTGPAQVVFSTSVDANRTIETLDVSSVYAWPTTVDASFFYETDFKFTPDIAYLTPYDSSLLIDVDTSSVNTWNLSVPSWISVDKTNGTGSDTIKLYVNSNVNRPTEQVNATTKWAPGTFSIEVSYGYETAFTFTPNIAYLTPYDSSISIDITTDPINDWTLTVPSWVSVDKLSGTGSDTVKVTVDSIINRPAEDIDAEANWTTSNIIPVEVSFGYQTDLDVIPDSLLFTINGASKPPLTVDVSTIIVNNWNVNNYPSIIYFDKYTGAGDDTLTVTTTGTDGESGSFKVSSGFADTKTVNFQIADQANLFHWGFDGTLESDYQSLYFIRSTTGSLSYTLSGVELNGEHLYIDDDYTSNVPNWIKNSLSPDLDQHWELWFNGRTNDAPGTYNLISGGNGSTGFIFGVEVAYGQHPGGNWGNLINKIVGSFYGYSFSLTIDFADRVWVDGLDLRISYHNGFLFFDIDGTTVGFVNTGVTTGTLNSSFLILNPSNSLIYIWDFALT